jgi:DNA-binding MarR family transcriptional regulator
MALSNIDRAHVAKFVAREKEAAPDWFLSDAADNFASPTDIVLYFSAFCVGVAHLNSALGQVDAMLKRIKSIMAHWQSLTSGAEAKAAEAKGLRLKAEEKMLVHIYRALCAGKGGLSVADAANAMKLTDPAAEKLLNALRDKGIVARSPNADRWRLVVRD